MDKAGMVPLHIYRGGQRHEVGKAKINEDGSIEGTLYSNVPGVVPRPLPEPVVGYPMPDKV